MTGLIDIPEHWRKRAQETRRMADMVTHPESKRTLLDMAESYERLAKTAEGRGKQTPGRN